VCYSPAVQTVLAYLQLLNARHCGRAARFAYTETEQNRVESNPFCHPASSFKALKETPSIGYNQRGLITHWPAQHVLIRVQ